MAKNLDQLFEGIDVDEFLKQLLKERNSKTSLHDVVQNILDEPIPQEVKKRLLKSLIPKTYPPAAPSMKKKERKRKAILAEFDPYLPQGRQAMTNYQNEFLALYNALEGVEQGRRYIRWVLNRRLGENRTPSIMVKLRERINTSFYFRYLYSHIIMNNEDKKSMVIINRKEGHLGSTP